MKNLFKDLGDALRPDKLMKEKDTVKVNKMPKNHIWRTSFGVLFTGLSGELKAIVHHVDNTRTYLVNFTASEYDSILVMFNEEELKLIVEFPICKNILEPKNSILTEATNGN